MKEGPDISRIAALIGDPARGNMLAALMDGRALTARELAEEAGITAATASGHLRQLVDGGLLQERKQGRHKFFSLAHADVALALEALMGLASGQMRRARTGPRDDALREARVCYNHLAGRLGVQMFDSLRQRGFLAENGEELSLTPEGQRFAVAFGLDLAALAKARAPLCRSCLDWSERRSHLAGSLGRAFLAQMEGQGWLRRDGASRALVFAATGRAAFEQAFPKG